MCIRDSLSYFILVGGVYPALIYSLSLVYIQLLSPVLPNINWTLEALVFTIVPLVGIILMDQFFSNRLSKYLKIPSISKYRGEKSTWLAFTLISSILLIWFVNGFFPIHPTVILSDSMMPSLKRGDIVIVKNANINEVHMNDIVEYISRDGKIIVHRVVDEVNYSNLKVIVTKGMLIRMTMDIYIQSRLEGLWPGLYLTLDYYQYILRMY